MNESAPKMAHNGKSLNEGFTVTIFNNLINFSHLKLFAFTFVVVLKLNFRGVGNFVYSATYRKTTIVVYGHQQCSSVIPLHRIVYRSIYTDVVFNRNNISGNTE